MVVLSMSAIDEIDQAVQQDDPEALYELVTSWKWDELPWDDLNAVLRTIAHLRILRTYA